MTRRALALACAPSNLRALTERFFGPAFLLPSSKKPDFVFASVSAACAAASPSSNSAFVLRLLMSSQAWWWRGTLS